ncbi:HlyD family efflux transporter periplasmic adaptor subunit [Candidatus Poribacteria bacterium]|nr:HlyD family efflux transporter periplasmic adaptor subunit [Candidatus Poribacteria bacterium]
MKQAQANYNAAVAQRDSAREQTVVTTKRRDSELAQAVESVQSSRAALESAKQTTIQQTGQAETDILTATDSLERDRIALTQAEIQLQQLDIADTQLKAQLNSAKISRDNAQRELARSQELFDKKYLSRKALEDSQQALASAESSYESAQKNVDAQAKSIESQKATIAAQKRVISSRETTLKFQRANLETLKASRDASERQAAANLASAQSRLNEIRETIDAEKKMAQFSEASAEANVLRAQSALKNANQRLGWTVVRAPKSGTVTNLELEEGEIITSGRSAFSQGPAIMTVADLSQMIVKAAINEVDMGQVSLDQRAEISVSAFPNKKFDGRVRAIAPSGRTVDNVVRFELEIEVVGSPQELMPGMTADVDIFVIDREDVLQVPIEAVQEEDSFGIQMSMKPEEQAKVAVGDKVTLEMRLGKSVEARVDSLGDLVQLSLLGSTQGWRPGPVEFTLVTGPGERLPSLSGRATQTKSRFVEVVKPGGEKGEKKKPEPEVSEGPPAGGGRPGGGPPGGGPGGGRPGGAPGGTGGNKGEAEEPPPPTDRVPVQVGMKNEAFYEIVSGLSPGTSILVKPPVAAQPQRPSFGRGG